MSNSIIQNINRRNLWQLILLRCVAIFGQSVTIIFTHFLLKIELPLTAMFLIICALILINLCSFYRYKKHKNISDKSLFFELFFDVSAFALSIYFSGGASNPFISLFLLQVIIATILLKQNYAYLIAIITTIYYVLLSLYYQHLHAFHEHGNEMGIFNLHLQGMLISYVLATILLVIFISKIMENLRLRDEKIRQMKEENQMVRNGLLAVSAAHELSTPLTTISVIISDWKNFNFSEDLQNDITKIEKQISNCEKIIDEILVNSKRKRLKNS